jgi:cytochrome c oxidase cbb3-type subunit 3
MNQTIRFFGALLLVAGCFLCYFPVEGFGQRGQSPAAQRPPETVTPQSYPPEQVAAGQPRFVARCGFCHGRDAGGGEGGPDLTRSLVVAEDAYGDRIGDLLQAGTAAADMHAFDLDEAEFEAIVAFIHAQKTQAESVAGGRQFVDVADLQTGDAGAGRAYFNGSGGCATCHSVTGDLAGVASRFEGIDLMRRMLYPSFGRPAPAPATVTVTLASGETVIGPLASQSEFTISIRTDDGESQSWSVDDVDFVVDDPVTAHFDQLGRYTDGDMHDVYAYLETLR